MPPAPRGARDRGDTARAWELALRERGFLVPSVDYPGFGAAGPYLRLALSAEHRAAEIDALLAIFAELLAAPPR